MRSPLRAAAALLLLAAAPGLAMSSRPATVPPGQPRLSTVPLAIATAKGPRRFTVEVARSGSEQERGLMHRTAMAPDAGMIFPMDPPRRATFWMRNTVLPLDLLFIRANGTIARISPGKPYSLAMIDAGEPVAAVLELNAGTAARLGIRAGDRVSW